MKCSEYLWLYLDIHTKNCDTPGWSPEQAQGETRLAMEANGDREIVSDTTGEKMTEREARSVLGRNEADLNVLYHEGDRDKFEAMVRAQLGSDDEHHAAMEDGDGGDE